MGNPQSNRDADAVVDRPEALPLPTSDWDALCEEVDLPVPAEEIETIGPGGLEQDAAQSLEEEDDNPYQESDEALPDDEEEAAINRDLYREGTFFNEV